MTRDYGATADEKVNELMRELLIAVLSITVLLTLFLGWREALIVALAVPLTLAITLTGNMMFGYTINRVTLFALILSLGLLVDDPIIDVENIHRHFQLREHPPLEATLVAVDEVRAPTILATFTVIISFIPLYFVTGMMGPYMAPHAPERAPGHAHEPVSSPSPSPPGPPITSSRRTTAKRKSPLSWRRPGSTGATPAS